MNKSSLIVILLLIILIVLSITIYISLNNNKTDDSETVDKDINLSTSTSLKGNKILVVYFSAQNHTKIVAEKIAANLNADLFEIIPQDIYTEDDLNWSNNNSRVSKEHDDISLREIKLQSTTVKNWEQYDTVLIGYPIWWGIAAWPVNNFVKDNDFTGKTVIPFCTSASSGLGQSGKLLEELAGSGNWKSGHRFSSSASDNDIKSFTDSIK